MNHRSDERGNQVLARALAYARHAGRYFRADRAARNRPPPTGTSGATTGPRRIVDWWRAVPGRDVPRSLPAAPGPDVLDVDAVPPETGSRLAPSHLAGSQPAGVRPRRPARPTPARTAQRQDRGEHLDFKAARLRPCPAFPRRRGCLPVDRMPAGRRWTFDWVAGRGLLAPRSGRPERRRPARRAHPGRVSGLGRRSA